MRFAVILLITIILVSCDQMQAYVPGIDPTATATFALTPTSTVTPRLSRTAQPTMAPEDWSICTGVESGTVNVRSCAGTSCSSIAVLEEGRAVMPGSIQEVSAGSRWVLITTPVQGWMNANYLCKGVSHEMQTD
jgi:hypothetical protein